MLKYCETFDLQANPVSQRPNREAVLAEAGEARQDGWDVPQNAAAPGRWGGIEPPPGMGMLLGRDISSGDGKVFDVR